LSRLRLTTRLRRDRGLRAFYTVLILPHSRSRLRKLHVSRAFVVTLGLLSLLLAAAGLLAPHLWLRSRTQALTVARLEQENRQLREEREHFESGLADVSQSLSVFESQARELADELGLEDLEALKPAVGGGLDRRTSRRALMDDELGAVRSRANGLNASLEELNRAFEQRVRQLAAVPDRMPVEGWFSHGYGWRKDPFTGKRQFHRGIDIVADAGTPILAPADGLVSRATRVSDLGKTVDISHGYGYVTRYAHMSELLVRPGQRVHRGDVIGRVGSTGRSTGPHLHYEVFRDGRHVNPWKYLGQTGS